MQSDQRNQANDERIERLMLVGDGHAMQFLEIAHCRIADVFRNAIGHAVDEFDVQSRVAVFDHALAERALIGDEGTGQSHHVIERFRDVADFSIGVPLLQLRDDFVDDVVEHGVRNLVFVLEIVVEERSGHAYATCDIADRDFRKALFQADCAGCMHDLRAACVSDCCCGGVVLSVHGFLSFVRVASLTCATR